MFPRSPEHPLEMHWAKTTVLRVAPPCDVEQRQNAVKDALILITIVRRRTLLEDLPLQAFFFVVLNVVRRAPLGIRQGVERPLHLGKSVRIARAQVVRMVAFGQQTIHALDRLRIR